MKLAVLERDFDEGKHPRDDHGRWSESGGSEGGDGEGVTSSNVSDARKMGEATPAQFVASRNESKRTAFLSDKSAEELKGDKLFLSSDKKTGYALDVDNDLQNLFNNGPVGGGKIALDDAIKKGASTLDAFDGHLPMLYAKHGFVPTGRIKFSDEHAPKGWDYAKYGRPDVVFMAYRGGDRQTIEERAGTFPAYDRNQGAYFTDFDFAKAASRSAVMDKGIDSRFSGVNGTRYEHRGRGQFHQELEDASRRSDEFAERLQLETLIERGLCLEDYPRRIFVRSALIKAHHAIALMEAEGFELIPYDGPYIPGTELIDVSEWEERELQAEPKTLYVNRPLLNAEDVIAWAKSSGFAKTITADDMHVTVAFSRALVDWDTLTESHSVLTIGPGGQRSVERLGPNGEATVLRFESQALTERWRQFVEAGASWDYENYKPHITISFDAGDIDVDDIEPYDGELVFGPEIFAELDEDWKAGVTEKDVDYIQDPATGKFQGSHPHGGDKEGSDKPEGGKIEPSKEAMAVGGDEWNKQTAERLEKEFVEAAPKLEEIVSEAVSAKVEVEPEAPDPDNAPIVPEEWDMMSGDDQDQAWQEYKDKTFSDFQDSEIQNWQENSAMDDAASEVAYNFTKGKTDEWAYDAIKDFRTDNDLEILFTDAQLVNALVVDFESNGYNDASKVDISFDDSKLGKPSGFDELPQLPGIEPQKPEDFLTKEMRDALETDLNKAFVKEAESVVDKIEPPDYLNDSVAEYQETVWGDMSDKEKFGWVNSNTDIISEHQKEYDEYFGEKKPGGEDGKIDVLPKKFDPLQQNASHADYVRTQQIARHLSVERAAQIMVERGIYKAYGIHGARADAKKMDRTLWEAWKGSSHGEYGQLLQKATADELGGRLNPQMVTHDEYHLEQLSKDVAPNAEKEKAYEAVKAYVRGKWETSQYLLKKAGVETVNVYRAVNIPETAPPTVFAAGNPSGSQWWVDVPMKTFDSKGAAEAFKATQAAKNPNAAYTVTNPHGEVYRVKSVYKFDTNEEASKFADDFQKDPNNPAQHIEKVSTPEQDEGRGVTSSTEYKRLPDIHVARNGAASTSLDAAVSNGWDGGGGRVVLRASVPRTSVVSVPAYGINIQGEHEVVVAGTAYKGWDAWYGQAPPFDKIKIGHQIAA